MKRNLVIIAGAAVAVLALFFLVAIKPIGVKISAAQKDVQTAEQQTNNLNIQVKQLEEARKLAPGISARLAKSELLLPKSPDLPTFIRQVQSAADDSGVDLISIAPTVPAPLSTGAGGDPALANKGVFTLGVTLQVKGGFFRVVALLRRLEGLQRVVEVTTLTISPLTEEGVTSLSSSISLSMFVVNPAAPLPGASASPSTSGGGGSSGPSTPAPSRSP